MSSGRSAALCSLVWIRILLLVVAALGYVAWEGTFAAVQAAASLPGGIVSSGNASRSVPGTATSTSSESNESSSLPENTTTSTPGNTSASLHLLSNGTASMVESLFSSDNVRWLWIVAGAHLAVFVPLAWCTIKRFGSRLSASKMIPDEQRKRANFELKLRTLALDNVLSCLAGVVALSVHAAFVGSHAWIAGLGYLPSMAESPQTTLAIVEGALQPRSSLLRTARTSACPPVRRKKTTRIPAAPARPLLSRAAQARSRAYGSPSASGARG